MIEIERPIVELEKRIQDLKNLVEINPELDVGRQLKDLERRIYRLRARAYSDIDPWEQTQISRHPQRPYTLDYIEYLCTDWVELRGDRLFMDDPPIVGGLARFEGNSVMIIGHQKGRNTKENLHRNFGMPRPEGYRKALRLMRMAERFNLPIFCFVDTPGAYPGIDAEARGQAEAIATNVLTMSSLKVPIIVTIIGEGGSGGALAIAVGNRVIMLENSIYSVIAPESCAAILWRDSAVGPTAARALKYSARDCARFGVADVVVKEPPGGAHHDVQGVMGRLNAVLHKQLATLKKMSPEGLVEDRYQRFRRLGKFNERRSVSRSSTKGVPSASSTAAEQARGAKVHAENGDVCEPEEGEVKDTKVKASKAKTSKAKTSKVKASKVKTSKVKTNRDEATEVGGKGKGR